MWPPASGFRNRSRSIRNRKRRPKRRRRTTKCPQPEAADQEKLRAAAEPHRSKS